MQHDDMAQQSARRDRDNQAATSYFEYATLIWTRSANSHAGRRSMAAQRPDRWQHPTTRHGIPDVFPCPEGGVHRCCMDRRCGRTELDPCSGSCDADVLRAPEIQHPVQNVGGGGYLGCLSPVRLRTQPLADDALPARDIALHESAPSVPRGPLPAHATALGDASYMEVAPRRRGLGIRGWHRARARRHDDVRVRIRVEIAA